MSMLRILLEFALVIGLIVGALYVNKTMAKESRENKARMRDRITKDDTPSD